MAKTKSRKTDETRTASEGASGTTSAAQSASEPRQRRTAQLLGLLNSDAGATIDDLCAAFAWQPHSARAALSGLRKAGHAVERIVLPGPGVPARYRIAGVAGMPG